MFRLQPFPAAVALLCSALTACGDSSQPDDPRTQPPLVRVVAVQPANDDARAFTGIVASRIQSDLGFRVPGKILERLVDKGQTVKNGQPLLRLDPQDLSLQAKAQDQAVAAAKARAKQAAADEARYRSIVGTGAISASQYDQIKAQADSARADLQAAIAQANVAKNAMNYAVLTADSDGVIMDTLAEPGQVVTAGQAVIRLARAGQREAVVDLPETLRPALGTVAQAHLYGSDGAPVAATLRQLSDAADPQTRTFEAKFVLAGALSQAPLGSTVTVAIPDAGSPSQSVIVPLASLYDAGKDKGTGVWVVSGKPAKVSWQAVSIRRITDESAVVATHLDSHASIVALGAHLLHEGEEVRPLAQGTTDLAGAP
ncbi:efflux RND transporter periplasmic adaptor subunit [Cedecea neteri]|uniref:efflux RND transporter periplasmic adaptor subunit n=1 Tax=Cedecea neteri TaxID=158822 RepID=UPI002AA834D7|nr:efflux RND transporter periplasmic adaptor subunit [Cedecea neteri]WPU21015.1 efflux RND transporter periplasmic adaptor subunit [Cedecea neteri]